MLSERQRRIFREAELHDGRYLLPRMFRAPEETATETDHDYVACRQLVYSGHARWLSFASTFAPGIKLTGKPLE